MGKSVGVCATATPDADGECMPPSNYRSEEFGCGAANPPTAPDGLDNDCDGITDEVTASAVSTGDKHACWVSSVTNEIFCWGVAHGSSAGPR
jgi:hypothetical protein